MVDDSSRFSDENVLYLVVDGAMVHIRDKLDNATGTTGDGWTESKHAVIFHTSDLTHYIDKNGHEQHEIEEKEFVGVIDSVSVFKFHLLAPAKRHGSDECSEIVALSDGSQWIANMVKEILPGTTHILDLYHARANLWKFLGVVFKEDTFREEFGAKVETLLDDGTIDELLKRLAPFKDRTMSDGVLNFYTYAKNQKGYMSYVLSVIIDSGNKQLMQTV